MAASKSLVGVAEIASMGDVSRQTAHEWVTRSSFPEPVARLKMGPVWQRDAVSKWIQRKRRADKARERLK